MAEAAAVGWNALEDCWSWELGAGVGCALVLGAAAGLGLRSWLRAEVRPPRAHGVRGSSRSAEAASEYAALLTTLTRAREEAKRQYEALRKEILGIKRSLRGLIPATVPRILKPLEPLREHVTVVSGLENTAWNCCFKSI